MLRSHLSCFVSLLFHRTFTTNPHVACAYPLPAQYQYTYAGSDVRFTLPLLSVSDALCCFRCTVLDDGISLKWSTYYLRWQEWAEPCVSDLLTCFCFLSISLIPVPNLLAKSYHSGVWDLSFHVSVTPYLSRI